MTCLRVQAMKLIFESFKNLALKVMMVVFQTTLSSHWSKIAKLTKDLISKKMGGAALYSFADFVVDVNLPISLLILPILQNKVIFCTFFDLLAFAFFKI